jgi:hypothetical protein
VAKPSFSSNGEQILRKLHLLELADLFVVSRLIFGKAGEPTSTGAIDAKLWCLRILHQEFIPARASDYNKRRKSGP